MQGQFRKLKIASSSLGQVSQVPSSSPEALVIEVGKIPEKLFSVTANSFRFGRVRPMLVGRLPWKSWNGTPSSPSCKRVKTAVMLTLLVNRAIQTNPP